MHILKHISLAPEPMSINIEQSLNIFDTCTNIELLSINFEMNILIARGELISTRLWPRVNFQANINSRCINGVKPILRPLATVTHHHARALP